MEDKIADHFIFLQFPLSSTKTGDFKNKDNSKTVMLAPVAVHAEKGMLQVFKAGGLPVSYCIIEGVGHEVPKDFSKKLSEAIEYLNFNS